MYIPFHPPQNLGQEILCLHFVYRMKKEKYKKISRIILRISLFEESDAPEGWTPIKGK